MKFSVILPTFHRPDDVEAFLQSMTQQTFKDFEIVIGDGSLDDSVKKVVDKFTDKLNIKYLYEKGCTASRGRNMACQAASGEYLLFIDSDCIVPEHYMQAIDSFLRENPVEAFGGADKALPNFTTVQKAINYAMTSWLTTGGIRGKRKSIDKFHLRGFNMGIRRDVFFELGGFDDQMEVGEDLDLSFRLQKAGYKAAFIPEAFVFHKRRDTLAKFARQLFMHGSGRVDLYKRHKDALKLVHFLPTMFVIYLFLGIISAFVFLPAFWVFLATIVLYSMALWIDASIYYKSVKDGFVSMIAAWIMLISYGLGFAYQFVRRVVLNKGSDTAKSIKLKL